MPPNGKLNMKHNNTIEKKRETYQQKQTDILKRGNKSKYTFRNITTTVTSFLEHIKNIEQTNSKDNSKGEPFLGHTNISEMFSVDRG